MFRKIKFWLYHLLRPIIDLKLTSMGLVRYPSYLADLCRYKRFEGELKMPLLELCPKLFDQTQTTPVDYHYFYQQLWVFKNVLEQKPNRHLDVGSTLEMSGYLAQIVPTTFVDLRPIEVQIKNLKVIKADITRLPLESNSVESLSCLHVAEHIGLSRYGDKLDPKGTQKACAELQRILAPGGYLYFSVPVGHERVCFNAHRVFNPQTIVNFFSELKLEEFSAIDDSGNFLENVSYQDYGNLDYGCGLFIFQK